MAEIEGCPIESNIKSTAGRNDAPPSHAMDMSLSEDNYNDSNDAEFDDEDGDPMGVADDEWGSLHSSDDQNLFKPKDDDVVMIGANEENPFAEGNEAVKVVQNGMRPLLNNKGDPKQKCWICDVCHAINNLLESMQKYNYKCCFCSYAYHPQVAIIFSNDWDGMIRNNDGDAEEEIHTVWSCSVCTFKNLMEWTQCEGCHCQRPPEAALIVSYSYVKPKKFDGFVNHNQDYNAHPQGPHGPQGFQGPNQINMHFNLNNNQNKKKPKKNFVRKPRIGNIGIPRNITEYPASSVVNDPLEDRLVNIFGKPFRNGRLVKAENKWGVDCEVLHSRIEWKSVFNTESKPHVKEEMVGRGFAINSRTGWVATMTSDHIFVFRPDASTQYTLMAQYSFTDPQKLTGQDVANSRIRFVGRNAIFVWSFSRSRVYSFKVYENSLILLDVIKDKYFKDSQTMDVAICNDLLILLFDRWVGVYRLYPKFEWYHAVAFATKSVNCFSLEIVDYDGEEEEDDKEEDRLYKNTNCQYVWINTEDQLIGIHPANPTFDFLHIAQDAKHAKCKYTVSKHYGVFYLSNDGLALHQSSRLEVASNHKLMDLRDKEPKKKKLNGIEPYHDMILGRGIEKLYNVVYDEMYGICGRLLVYCQTKKKEFMIHQFVNQKELQIFYEELSNLDDYYSQLVPGMQTTEKFNLIVFVYQMLFGDDMIHTLIHTHYKINHTTLEEDANQWEGSI